MAEPEDKERASEQEPPQEAAARKGGLAGEWRKLATWQKAGVLIGGGALVVAVLIYINRQQTPTATGNDTSGTAGSSSPGYQYTGYPGEGDQFPPVPVPPTTPPPTSPTPVKPPTSPVSPVHGGPIHGPISPIRTVHDNPITAPSKPIHNSKGDLSARQKISGNQIKLLQSSGAASSIFRNRI